MLDTIQISTYCIVWSLEKPEYDIVEVKFPLRGC